MVIYYTVKVLKFNWPSVVPTALGLFTLYHSCLPVFVQSRPGYASYVEWTRSGVWHKSGEQTEVATDVPCYYALLTETLTKKKKNFVQGLKPKV